MKKGFVVLMVCFFLLTSLTLVFAAEMVKEGESDYTAAMSWAFKSLPMEKERVEFQFEVFGAVVDAKEDSPLYKATFYGLGELHALKGNYEERGFIRYTRPDGDQIFATYEAGGSLVSGERKIKGSLVGGTGKCTGITGGGEWRGVSGLRPPKEGVGMSVSIGKYNWKIP
jgi:hypothetical protein